MRVVVQRVRSASVVVNENLKSSIGVGLLVLLGIEAADTDEDINWLVKKLMGLRIFNDDNQVMNLSIKDINGELMVVSQFTLHAATKKGNRPSYIKAAKPDFAKPMYLNFIKACEKELSKNVGRGTFGADMKVSLVNDGPVTIIIDSKSKDF